MTSQLLEGAGLRALYLAKRISCQLVGDDTPQVPMDPPTFILSPLSMPDVEYLLWKGGIAYTKRLLGDQGYEGFSEGCFMTHFPIRIYILSFPSSLLFFLYLMYVVTLRCDECFRVKPVQLLVALLILFICLGQSMPMVWMELLGSALWSVTLMSWVIPSLREHEL